LQLAAPVPHGFGLRAHSSMSVHPVPPLALPSPSNPVGQVHFTSPLTEPSGVGSLHVAPAAQGLPVHSSAASLHEPLTKMMGVDPAGAV
jgi:hypothetical protein